MSRRAFVTGAAGFIGANLCRRLLDDGWTVLGVDNLSDYYRVDLKHHRLKGLQDSDAFTFLHADLIDEDSVYSTFSAFDPEILVHLAAQAGVRYSIEQPRSYIDSNVSGFLTVLECARRATEHSATFRRLVYASSSSVYGQNGKIPYATSDRVDHPVSLYAATKRANELMAYTYSQLYGVHAVGLRFFTVYGPAGRPDMAYFKFADKAVHGEPIEVYNMGDLRRDFTYIDDITHGIRAAIDHPRWDTAIVPHKIYNLGNSKPESVVHFIDLLEASLQRHGLITEPIERMLLPMQPGDVYQTYADMRETERDLGFSPTTTLRDGLERFVQWYASYEPFRHSAEN